MQNPPEDNDGSEIYIKQANIRLKDGCNSIEDNRTAQPPLVTTLLLMNGSFVLGTINAEYNKGKVKLYDPLGFGVNIGISRTGGKEMLEVLKRHPAISLEADSDITLHMCYGVTLNVNREAHPELWLMSRKSNFEGSNLARRLNKYSKGVKPTVKLLGSKEK